MFMQCDFCISEMVQELNLIMFYTDEIADNQLLNLFWRNEEDGAISIRTFSLS